MQHSIYAIKDKAANAYLQPFFTVNEATAVRALKTAVDNPQHDFHKHAKDYSLYFMGVFDDVTGVIAPLAEPVFVFNMETLILASQEERHG